MCNTVYLSIKKSKVCSYVAMKIVTYFIALDFILLYQPVNFVIMYLFGLSHLFTIYTYIAMDGLASLIMYSTKFLV